MNYIRGCCYVWKARVTEDRGRGTGRQDWEENLYNGLLGALTANLFEGTGIIKENVGYYKSGKNLLTAGISPEQVAELGKTLSNQDVYTLAQRVDENTGAYTVGRLLGEIGATLTDANKATIADALESRGVRGSDAKVITAAVSAVMNGAELNAQQAQMLEANDVLAQTVLDVVTSESDLIQKNQQYRQLTDAAKTGTLNTAPAQTPSTPTGVQQQLANLTDLSGLTGEQRQFLQRYQQQLQSTEALRSQVQSLQQRLAQRKAKGQSAGWLMPDQAREASLGRLLQRKESTLRSMESSPLFQQLSDMLAPDPAPETAYDPEFDQTLDQPVENRREKDVENKQTYVRIYPDGNVITDGSHIKNGKLKPNVTYQTGEHAYLYSTNADGLIATVHVDELYEKEHDGRLEHDPNTYGKLAGYHAGHLIGDRFGGSPELDNLVSQAALVNLSKYKKIENQWAKAIKAGKKVSVDITVNYDVGTRPVSFVVEYTIDGTSYKSDIPNE